MTNILDDHVKDLDIIQVVSNRLLHSSRGPARLISFYRRLNVCFRGHFFIGTRSRTLRFQYQWLCTLNWGMGR